MLHYQYVLLAYAYSPEQDAAFPIAAIAVMENAPASNLTLYVLEDWQKRVREDHQEYLRELFEDWAGALNDEALAVMPRLGTLSVGPLRTAEAGKCDENEFVPKVSQFLVFPYIKLSGV